MRLIYVSYFHSFTHLKVTFVGLFFTVLISVKWRHDIWDT